MVKIDNGDISSIIKQLFLISIEFLSLSLKGEPGLSHHELRVEGGGLDLCHTPSGDYSSFQTKV
jgi:hypothetical protein